MGKHLKFSDKKKLQRAFSLGRNRGEAAERRRTRAETEQDDSERLEERPENEDEA
jgi:hypothetical protein